MKPPCSGSRYTAVRPASSNASSSAAFSGVQSWECRAPAATSRATGPRATARADCTSIWWLKRSAVRHMIWRISSVGSVRSDSIEVLVGAMKVPFIAARHAGTTDANGECDGEYSARDWRKTLHMARRPRTTADLAAENSAQRARFSATLVNPLHAHRPKIWRPNCTRHCTSDRSFEVRCYRRRFNARWPAALRPCPSRPRTVSLAGFAVFVIVRYFMIPADFGALRLLSRRRAGRRARRRRRSMPAKRCASTATADVGKIRQDARHAKIALRGLPRPARRARDGRRRPKPPALNPRLLCLRCHTTQAGQPAGFPNVVPADHAGDARVHGVPQTASAEDRLGARGHGSESTRVSRTAPASSSC